VTDGLRRIEHEARLYAAVMQRTSNPLLDDRLVEFLLYDLFEAEALTALPAFAEHGRETFEMYLDACRRLARGPLFAAYKPMDESPPRFSEGRIFAHEAMGALWGRMAELGVLTATRPASVGGEHLPSLVATFAHAYLMAANLSAYGYVGLSSGAAHLIEAFGTDELRERYMQPIYDGKYSGTMALTEPQAGSGLADVTTRATPAEGGHFLISGSKIFISGGDHDFLPNVVHLVLARIDGSPPGTKGISLFCVPKRRVEGESLVDNDVAVAGAIHKIGWRGLPSLALNFGEGGDCHGYLVGEPNKGLAHMFQLMNEARLMIGINGASTAAVAYHEAVNYAFERVQGRDMEGIADGVVPIVRHPDVRRMLLRQKAIVEGSFALLGEASRAADLAEHAGSADARRRAQLYLEILTPVAKSFPAEHGFEANALSVQVHGGYGYSSEYLPEAWLRDQKLNSIHEGTTGIQSLDLLGRRVSLGGGEALAILREEIDASVEAARAAGFDGALLDSLVARRDRVLGLTETLLRRGREGDKIGMLGHSVDYLALFSILLVSHLFAKIAARALEKRATEGGDSRFLEGLVASARYFLATELPKVELLADLCEGPERSYLDLDPEAFRA
jgi:alkylation response protein AidB-like acyl-CoA dehydrogenase